MRKRSFDVELAMWLVERTGMPLREIAEHVGTSYGALRLWYSKAYPADMRNKRKIPNYRASKLGDKNPMHGKRGPEHHNYVGRASDHKGYFTVVRPDWWTGETRGKRVFEHHVAYAMAHGLTEIPKGMHVHHVDHDPSNNDPSNLLLVTPAEHAALHRQNVSKGED
jgi:hypothetical protein